jgi:signal transduction histidine kinase
MEAARRVHDLIQPDRNIVKKAHRLQRTLEAAELLHSTLNIKQLTSIILEIIRSEVPVQRVTAFVVDRKENVVRSLVAQDVDHDPIVTPIGIGIAGLVAETGQTTDAPDAYAHPRFNAKYDGILGFQTTDILAFPLRGSKGDVNGVLELLNRRHAFRQEDLEFLQEVSVFIGHALENAALHEELQHKARLEEEVARSREHLSQMDRLVLVHEVLSTVLNELTTAENVVTRQTALIKNDPHVTKRLLRHLEFMEAANLRSTEAIRTLFNLAQRPEGGIETIDIRELIRNIMALRSAYWALNSITVEVSLDEVPLVQGRYVEIQQAIIHVIRNAEDAVSSRPNGRRIRIHAGLMNDSRQVRIEVRDNGDGIATEIYERVFEPFFSTRRESGRTGLGLSIAHRVVHEHGGEILFDTDLEQGTAFTITFPV